MTAPLIVQARLGRIRARRLSMATSRLSAAILQYPHAALRLAAARHDDHMAIVPYDDALGARWPTQGITFRAC